MGLWMNLTLKRELIDSLVNVLIIMMDFKKGFGVGLSLEVFLSLLITLESFHVVYNMRVMEQVINTR